MSEPINPAEKQKRKPSSRVWMLLSLALTLAILAWAFSLPFRRGGLMQSGSGKMTGSPTDVVVSGSDVSFSSAEQFRASAIAMDQEFMRARREKNRLKEVPGSIEVKRRWNQRVESVRQKVKELGDPEEGTLQWRERQELLDTLKDAPR